jgi:DNA mismatch repair protein MutS2
MARCLAESDKPPFAPLEPISPILARARVSRAVLGPKEIRFVAALCEVAAGVLHWYQGWKDRTPSLAIRVERLDPCRALWGRIEEVLDARGQVKDTASPHLGSLRQKQSVLRNQILERLERILQNKRDALQEQVVTIREGRYVLPVRPDAQRLVPGVVHGASGSGATVFVEPMETVEDNNRLRALADEEESEVLRLLRELTAEIASHQVPLAVTAGELAAIEVIAAKARFGEEFEGLKLEWSEDGQLELRGVRHPLLASKGRVVPIDVALGGEKESTLVITGPNTGGKTVALKTIGLGVCMMQAGIPVLAKEGSRLPFFDSVIADIGDEQSIEQSLSTFSSHMAQVIEALKLAGPLSLVLLDELGAGTDPAEGSALGIAVLEALRDKGATVVATTHHEPVKAFAYATPGASNAAVEFDEETLEPTFRLLMGPAGESRAFQVARRLGLDSSVVDRARALRQPGGVEDLIRRLEEESRRLNALGEDLSASKAELDRQAEEQISALFELEKERSSLRKMVTESLQVMRRQVEEFIADVRRGRREPAFPQEVFDQSDSLSAALEPVASMAQGEQLHPGQRVLVSSLGKEGVVRSFDLQGAEVSVGLVTVRLTAEEVAQGALMPLALQAHKPRPATFAVTAGQENQEFRMELNLLGKRVDEALPQVDKWLDEAVMVGLARLRIVHGKGTGALRKAVAELLKGHPHVRDHGPAPLEEGGVGVTVVELVE